MGILLTMSLSVVIHGLETNLTKATSLAGELKQANEALRESEERYRTLAEAAPDLIFIIGPDNRLQYVNSFAAVFIGLPPEELIGQPRERFFPPHPPAISKGRIS
jgi:PAS domain-containing protein